MAIYTRAGDKGKTQLKDGKKVLRARINYDYCKGCGLCAAECPVKAISMEKEKNEQNRNISLFFSVESENNNPAISISAMEIISARAKCV